MPAFGVTPFRVLGMAMMESLLIGIAVTAVGLLGRYLLSWVIKVLTPHTLPDV